MLEIGSAATRRGNSWKTRIGPPRRYRAMRGKGPTFPAEGIERRIYLLRGQKVMLSLDLAEPDGVEPRVLVQAVKRNRDRFPSDFMFQLSRGEFAALKSRARQRDVAVETAILSLEAPSALPPRGPQWRGKRRAGSA